MVNSVPVWRANGQPLVVGTTDRRRGWNNGRTYWTETVSPLLVLGSEAAFCGREIYWITSSVGGARAPSEDIADAGVTKYDEQRKRITIATNARWSRRPTCESIGRKRIGEALVTKNDERGK